MEYNVQGSINNWLNMFLMHRKMKTVVEGEQSDFEVGAI
jgi:hypothetical protein